MWPLMQSGTLIGLLVCLVPASSQPGHVIILNRSAPNCLLPLLRLHSSSSWSTRLSPPSFHLPPDRVLQSARRRPSHNFPLWRGGRSWTCSTLIPFKPIWSVATPNSMTAGLFAAYILADSYIRSAGTHVISATFSGAYVQDPRLQLIKSESPVIHEPLVAELLFYDDVEPCKKKGAVCARADLQPQIGFFGDLRSSRIDHNQFYFTCAVP